jgi:protein-S-isoprenylcysteine O-methyltransferase Ste14
MVGVITWLIDPAWMAWSAVALPIWLRWFGVVTAALLIWTFRTLDTNLTDTVVTRKNHTLVTSGPYRWVRHSLYLAFLMAMIAESLVMANWFLALTGGLTVLLIFIRTAREEANLLARFGDNYRQYMETTGRFFPRLGRHVWR